MTEEYTCIECENLYDDTDGDTSFGMCNKCLDIIYNKSLKRKSEERRDPNIRRSSTVHYPDWDLINKKYITRKRG
jgi:hypothetical protein